MSNVITINMSGVKRKRECRLGYDDDGGSDCKIARLDNSSVFCYETWRKTRILTYVDFCNIMFEANEKNFVNVILTGDFRSSNKDKETWVDLFMKLRIRYEYYLYIQGKDDM